MPTTVSSSSDQNLVAYATISDDKTLAITLINKAHGADATPVDVQIKLDAPLPDASVQTIELKSTTGDIAADASTLTIGGAAIQEDGTWKGSWADLPRSAVSGDTMTVTIPPASGMVLKAKI